MFQWKSSARVSFTALSRVWNVLLVISKELGKCTFLGILEYSKRICPPGIQPLCFLWSHKKRRSSLCFLKRKPSEEPAVLLIESHSFLKQSESTGSEATVTYANFGVKFNIMQTRSKAICRLPAGVTDWCVFLCFLQLWSIIHAFWFHICICFDLSHWGCKKCSISPKRNSLTINSVKGNVSQSETTHLCCLLVCGKRGAKMESDLESDLQLVRQHDTSNETRTSQDRVKAES